MKTIIHNGLEYAPISEVMPGLDILEEYLRNGAEIKRQDEMWWLFESNGEGKYCGKNLRALLVSIILGG